MRSGVAWPIVLREHAANDILVDLDPEGVHDLLAKLRPPPQSKEKRQPSTSNILPSGNTPAEVIVVEHRATLKCYTAVGFFQKGDHRRGVSSRT
jgi:hypothetical protein